MRYWLETVDWLHRESWGSTAHEGSCVEEAPSPGAFGHPEVRRDRCVDEPEREKSSCDRCPVASAPRVERRRHLERRTVHATRSVVEASTIIPPQDVRAIRDRQIPPAGTTPEISVDHGLLA